MVSINNTTGLTTKTKHTIKKQIGEGNTIIGIVDRGVTEGIKWAKTGAVGNTCLNIYLANDQVIFADGGNMLFMDGNINLETRMSSKGKKTGMLKTLKKAVGRAVSNENVFLNYYTGTDSSKEQRVCFGQALPGEFCILDLSQDEAWKLNHGAFVAGTKNIVVSGRFNWRGLIPVGQDAGAFVTTVKAKDGTGSAWLAAYGTIEKHDIKSGESLIVNNEHFLACPSSVNYNITRVGKNYKSMLLSGEGFAMEFTGPCTIYTQTKGMMRLAREIDQYLPDRKGGSFGGINFDLSDD
jgi:uncharacterized protein (TIGR00266 family)